MILTLLFTWMLFFYMISGISLIFKHCIFYCISCHVPATYIKMIYKANSNQMQKLQKLQHYQRNLTNSNKMQKLQHYWRNLTNMNAATHIYQRIKSQHLSNFISHIPKRAVEPLLQIEFTITLCLFRSCKNSKLLKMKKTKCNWE